ncbi:MAG: ATP-binding protein [Patescibacteria group bacterium]|jgi:predicted AAA+ superfamily ATPase|nr:ATP-binding protein [Patescibacteria group bacterium]
MFKRYIANQVENSLNEGLVVIVYGARQVGKTTLAKTIMNNYIKPLYINADDVTERVRLENKSAQEIKDYFGDADIVVIDEAQRIQNIGLAAKLVHDTYPEIKLLLTGSSSLDLAAKIKEPLTGRSWEYTLYPLSLDEIADTNQAKEAAMNRALVYGSYPGVWTMSIDQASQRLRMLATNYIYRDAFALQTIFDDTVMYNLLQLLAFQLGNEVSYNELANTLQVSRDTSMRYVDLLEKARIIYRLRQYRRNERSLIGKLRKVYFYDLGVRNGLVDNFKPLQLREDKGALWENFCINERQKSQQRTQQYTRQYYWRNRSKQEIDLIEESSGAIIAYEFKYSSKKIFSVPKTFSELYPNTQLKVLNIDNFITSLYKEYPQKEN